MAWVRSEKRKRKHLVFQEKALTISETAGTEHVNAAAFPTPCSWLVTLRSRWPWLSRPVRLMKPGARDMSRYDLFFAGKSIS
jgi:hypothetical protein